MRVVSAALVYVSACLVSFDLMDGDVKCHAAEEKDSLLSYFKNKANAGKVDEGTDELKEDEAYRLWRLGFQHEWRKWWLVAHCW